MVRAWILALIFAAGLGAQKQPPPKPQEPPEEDESIRPEDFAFNPLQANKELKVGEFYFKKKNYKAAANRFLRATKWNPGFAGAYLKLAEAEERLDDRAAAKAAYAKYLELNPSAKDADAIRKKLTSQK